MRFLRDASIRIKVLIPPAVLILALGLVALLALYGLNVQHTALSTVDEIALRKITLLDEFIVLSEQVQSDVFRIAVLRFMNLPEGEIQPIHEHLVQGVNDLKVIYGQILTKWSLDETERSFLERMKEPMEAFGQQVLQATAVVADNPSFGVLLVRPSTVPFAEFSDTLAELRDYQRAKIIRVETESHQRVRTVGTAIIGVVLLIALTGIVTTLLISTRWISRPIVSMTTLMRRLAEGDLSIEVRDLERRDEIGTMLRTLEVFRSNAIAKAQAEEALRESESRFRRIYDSNMIGIAYWDPSGRIMDANDAYLNMVGYARRDLGLGELHWPEMTPPEYAYLDERGMQEIRERGVCSPYEKEYIGKDGARVSVLIGGASLEGEEQMGISYTIDITERKQAEAEREALIEELEAKNAELERFTYTVSHDLKSPLITIKGFLGLMEKDAEAGDTERVKADVARISSAADKMQQLLDELLELSRIGRLVNPPVEVPMGELVRDAVSNVAGRLAERDAQVDIAPDLPLVYGDRPRLREVLENLVDNAVKFMGDQPNPRIEIGARRDDEDEDEDEDDGETVFYVRDNGVGIAHRYQDKVFGLFEKLDSDTEGTGIGLAIVKRIVEVHGGRIWVESEGFGQGSTFCFTLPGKSNIIDNNEEAFATVHALYLAGGESR